MTHAKSASDRAVRNFCLIALGQIGNMKGRDFLVTQVQKGQPHDRTFSALALGVYGNKCKESRTELGKVLLDAWNEVKNDSERGAFAIGMGLLDYKAAGQCADGRAEDRRIARPEGPRGDGARPPRRRRTRSRLIQELAKKSSDLDSQRRASIALGPHRRPGGGQGADEGHRGRRATTCRPSAARRWRSGSSATVRPCRP